MCKINNIFNKTNQIILRGKENVEKCFILFLFPISLFWITEKNVSYRAQKFLGYFNSVCVSIPCRVQCLSPIPVLDQGLSQRLPVTDQYFCSGIINELGLFCSVSV